MARRAASSKRGSSVSAASSVSGAGVIQGFQQVDSNKTGRLEKQEFRLAAEAAGLNPIEVVAEAPRAAPAVLSEPELMNFIETVRVRSQCVA